MKNIKYITLIALGLVACDPELENSIEDAGAYSAGTADFSKYVSVGNSLTAGFADGTVYRLGQEKSFPNILANQLSHAGGGVFTQPYVNDNIGGLLLNGTQISDPRMVLVYGPNGPEPTVLNATPTTEVSNINIGPYNNMGVPDAKVFHLGANGYGNLANLPNANPYFIRMASSANASVMEDVIAQNPTFFTLWIGANDILSYATSGGIGTDQAGNIDPSTYIREDITDPNVFASAYNDILTGLTANGAKGVVCNLPKVTDIPYFTTVPYNAIPMDAATAAGTNASYAGYNAILDGLTGTLLTANEAASRKVNFIAGQNPVLITDEDLTDISAVIVNPPFNVPAQQAALLAKLRPATQADLIILPTSSVLGELADPANPASVIGVGVPLNDSQALTEIEISSIENARVQFNATISALANANPDVILVDMAARLGELNNGGIPFSGGTVTSTYASGGGFSLDGVHPTARGYAIIANTIIDAINTNFNATIPKVDPGYYPTVYID